MKLDEGLVKEEDARLEGLEGAGNWGAGARDLTPCLYESGLRIFC